jgi:hypothetical protein
MLEFGDLNWWAIIVATVTGFLLGGVWYGPLFGNAWLAALGKTADDIEPSATPFIVSFFTSLVTALVLAALIGSLGLVGWLDGALIGLLVGVGFIAASMASDSAFCRWSMSLFGILAGYRVVYSAVMGAILGGWQ